MSLEKTFGPKSEVDEKYDNFSEEETSMSNQIDAALATGKLGDTFTVSGVTYRIEIDPRDKASKIEVRVV